MNIALTPASVAATIESRVARAAAELVGGEVELTLGGIERALLTAGLPVRSVGQVDLGARRCVVTLEGEGRPELTLTW